MIVAITVDRTFNVRISSGKACQIVIDYYIFKSWVVLDNSHIKLTGKCVYESVSPLIVCDTSVFGLEDKSRVIAAYGINDLLHFISSINMMSDDFATCHNIAACRCYSPIKIESLKRRINLVITSTGT